MWKKKLKYIQFLLPSVTFSLIETEKEKKRFENIIPIYEQIGNIMAYVMFLSKLKLWHI